MTERVRCVCVFILVGCVVSEETCFSHTTKVFPPYMALYRFRSRPSPLSASRQHFALCGLEETATSNDGLPSAQTRETVWRAYRDVRSLFYTPNASTCLTLAVVYDTTTSIPSNDGGLVTVGMWNYSHIVLYTNNIVSFDQVSEMSSFPAQPALTRPTPPHHTT